MLPTLQNSNLPQSNQLWDKLKSDLQNGFKITKHMPHQHDIIRVYTKHPSLDWQFLIIASTNHTSPPASKLELHILPPDSTTYQLFLTHSPLPEPNWNHQWKTLENMHPTTQSPDQDHQQELIQTYLLSEPDTAKTATAFQRNKNSKWLKESQ